MRRVLFVDDDLQLIEGLRKSMRAYREVWEMEFVHGPKPAMAMLEQGRVFDVVVSDSRMPEVDGAQVLTLVQKKLPEALRFVLSGQVATDPREKLANIAHQFLAKPCAAADIFERIERSLKVRDSLNRPELRATVAKFGNLPSLPEAYNRLSKLMGDPKSTMDQMAQVVESDTALSAKVLHVVNSAFFGLPRHISSVREAVRYLGIGPLRSITLSVEVFDGNSTTVKELRHRSLARAIAVQSMLTPFGQGDLGFVAGLLADVGVLLFLTRLSSEYQAIADEAKGNINTLLRLETERFGATHAEVGATLLGLWNLPGPLVEAVALHHSAMPLTSEPDVGLALWLVSALEELPFLPKLERDARFAELTTKGQKSGLLLKADAALKAAV